jgi:hypothetical protein
MSSETISKLACLRCEYRWFPRTERRPVRCPSCKSPYWDRARAAGARDHEPQGYEARMAEKLKAVRAGQRYYDAHRDEILAKYLGKYVAVTADGIIDVDDSYSELADRLFANGSYSLLITLVEETLRVYRLPVRFRVLKS